MLHLWYNIHRNPILIIKTPTFDPVHFREVWEPASSPRRLCDPGGFTSLLVGCKVSGLGFRVRGLGCRVYGFGGLGVQGLRV